MHGQIARHYQLPAVSMQSSIYPEVVAGRIPNRRITEDDLHPNDKGHELVASVITYALEKIHMTQTKDAKPEFPEPLTDNCYEKASLGRYRRGRHCRPQNDSRNDAGES